MRKFASFSVAILSALTLTAGAFDAVGAQTLYRSVGPDGRVTFSDVPTLGASAAGGRSAAETEPDRLRGLPYALRQVAERFPVTLFTSRDCAPCDAGRAQLVARGVPFDEKTVTSDEDGRALQAWAGDTRLPILRVAGTRLSGFNATAWTQTLDLAGYPAAITLPAGYRNGIASPLAPPQSPGS